MPNPPDLAEYASWSTYTFRDLPPDTVLRAMEALARVERSAAGPGAMIAVRWNSTTSLTVSGLLDATDVERLGAAYVEALDRSGVRYELTIRPPAQDDVLLHVIGGPQRASR